MAVKKIAINILLCYIVSSSFVDAHASIAWKTLPELVHDAPCIAKGTVSSDAGRIILKIDEMLKGQNYETLRIEFQSWFEVPDPQFTDGEAVLVFLKVVDPNGTAQLLGVGDQAKWPREVRTGSESKYMYAHARIYEKAALESIVDLVKRMLTVENAEGLDRRVELCEQYIASSNPLLQFTAMQYALGGHLWPVPSGSRYPTVPREISRQRFGILRRLSKNALSLIDSAEPEIRGYSARFLRYAEPATAIPSLIPMITDEDRLVRSFTKTTLGTLATDLKIKGAFTEYNPDDSAKNLESVQQQWNDWWEAHKDRMKSGMTQSDGPENAPAKSDVPAKTGKSVDTPFSLSQESQDEGTAEKTSRKTSWTALAGVLSASLHEMRFSWWYRQLWPGDFA